MLPPNWAEPDAGPQHYNLVSEGLQVRERYRPLGDSQQLEGVFDAALGAGADQFSAIVLMSILTTGAISPTFTGALIARPLSLSRG